MLANSVNESLDFVSDVRDYLNSVSEIFAAAFFVQNVPIDLACGKIGKLIQVFVNKAFVVSEIKIGFSAVSGDEHLAMLVGTHCTGIYIDIRVKLLRRNLYSPIL